MDKRIFVLGRIPFSLIEKDELLSRFVLLMRKRTKLLVVNINTFSSILYVRDNNYAKIVDAADIVVPDGWGPVWAARLEGKGSQLRTRINIGDYIDDLLKRMNKNSFSLFLLGSEDGVLDKTIRSIKTKYPKIEILGQQNGFFEESESLDIVKRIKKLRPNLVLVGMGQPKQEYWISDNWKDLPNSIYIGVGGLFHYIAGTKKRAPKWMRDQGLEWLFRLFQEPKRLWRRYTYENIKFITLTLRKLFGMNQ